MQSLNQCLGAWAVITVYIKQLNKHIWLHTHIHRVMPQDLFYMLRLNSFLPKRDGDILLRV